MGNRPLWGKGFLLGKIDAYILQGVAQEIFIRNMPGIPVTENAPRICGCHTFRVPGSDVSLRINKTDKTVFYSGLQTCGSVWACPVCARKITQGRADEIRQAIDIFKNRKPGGFVGMLTLTIPHDKGQSFETVRDRLQKGLRDMKRAKSRRRRTWGDLGVFHTITGIEPVYAERNGWHIHYHILVFFESAPDLADIKGVIVDEWIRYAGQGLSEKKKADMADHAVDLVPVKSWNDYLTKLSQQKASDSEIALCRQAFKNSWQINHEIALAHVKKGRTGSLSPFDMLRLIASLSPFDPDYKRVRDHYEKLFYEYAQAQKGRRYVYFSKGFKEWLGLADKDDSEILTEQEAKEMKESEHVATIPAAEWQEILSQGWRGQLLWLISEGLDYPTAMKKLRAEALSGRPQTHKRRRLAA